MLASLTACAPVVSMRPAPNASSIACASIVARLRDTQLGDLGYRPTDAQGTLAWGNPPQATLTCGTINPPPSSQCVVFDHVAWARTTTKGSVRFDSYGRQPNITVLLVGSSVDPTTALSTISEPVLTAIPRASSRCGG